MKFKQSIQQFLLSKTNWLALMAIAGGVAMFIYDEGTKRDAVEMIGGGLSLLFIRDGIAGINNGKA